ncbi:MAG: phosphoadenylyl-sulfate reductase, partial [Geminicoccaceae bacterium]|nr:phosphoadenylyl-sulfate reductase [Geminicoccaceae bacterium]
MRVRRALFPVAGVARFRAHPQDPLARFSELRPIVDKPIIQFAIEEARAAGVEEFIFVTCDEKSALESHLADAWPSNRDLIATADSGAVSSGEAIFVRQPERRGVGHAILLARELLGDEPFAVIIPNLLVLGERSCLAQMAEAYEAGSVLIATSPMPEDALSDFGVLDLHPGDQLEVRRVIEKPAPGEAPSDNVAFGRWILPPEALGELYRLSAETAHEVSLTNCINRLIGEVPVRATRFEGACYDVRTKKGLIKATVAHALETPDLSSVVSEAHRDFIDAGVRTLRSVQLSRRYEELSAFALLAQLTERDFAGRLALVSSFGTDSAILLHMISRIDPALPVLFLETGMLFEATLDYQRDLCERLGLFDVRLIRPLEQDLERADPDGRLHRHAPDSCCYVRKTLPLEQALEPFGAWITGRKRFQSATRADLPLFEEDGGGRIKVNPLAGWIRDELATYMRRHDLPAHPLMAEGYRSIGCAPCTTRVAPGEDERAGRWR